ncbi:MAG: hypothetical protein ACXVB1_00705, partial [Pseudobdellovibrionaceae bacterium]
MKFSFLGSLPPLRFPLGLLLLGGFLFISACVSVKLPSGAGAPAKDVKFEAPEKPYQEIKVLTADKAWLSAKT